MGNIINNNKSLYTLNCDENGIIIDISPKLLEILLYKKKLIIGQFIGVIMSPFMNYLHKNIFLRRYAELSNIQKNIINIMLSGKTKKRPLIIYNAIGEPIYINLSVKYKFNKKIFKASFDIIKDNIENIFYSNTIFNNKLITNDFKKSENRFVIITIFLKSKKNIPISSHILNMIYINKKFYNDLINIIQKYYYPYIYIHDIFDDSFRIILNADWTYNILSYVASLTLSFIINLVTVVTEYVNINIGITYDNIYYGSIDNKIKIFGNAKYLSQRFATICKNNFLVCDVNYYDKLLSENIYFPYELNQDRKICYFDGFSNVQYSELNLLNLTINYTNKFV